LQRFANDLGRRKIHITKENLKVAQTFQTMTLKALLLVCSLLLAPWRVAAMVELTDAIFKAKNLDEFMAANQQLEAARSGAERMRERRLAEEGLEDSQHILADSFGGNAGFYHGVASGTLAGCDSLEFLC
jgi:hypothetical protein